MEYSKLIKVSLKKEAKHIRIWLIVAGTGLFSNQIYYQFKELYKLKPVLEEAGLFPPKSVDFNKSSVVV